MAASLKISELNALTSLADDDLFLVTDTSATTSKKVTYANLKTGFSSTLANVIGVSAGAANLGTFSGDGDFLTDNVTVKSAIQTLAQGVSLRSTAASPSFTGTAAFAGDVNFNSGGLFFKQAQNRLGIGTTAPEGGFHVKHPTLNAKFQRDGGSSALNIKPNASDDGMTIQGIVNSGNSIIIETLGALGAVKFTNNANGDLASIGPSIELKKNTTVTGNLSVTGNLNVTGTTTQVNTVTMEAQNAIVFEGTTADNSETTLTIIDPNADRTIKLPNQSGCLPVLAADSSTAITATPEELNFVDGVTSAIQTQLDAKAPTADPTFTGEVEASGSFVLKANAPLKFRDAGSSGGSDFDLFVDQGSHNLRVTTPATLRL